MDDNIKKLENSTDYGDLAFLESATDPLEEFYSRYTWDVEAALQKRAEGVTVRQICRDFKISPSTYHHAKNQRLKLLGSLNTVDPTTHVAENLPNPARVAESMGAGIEQVIHKGLELANSWCLALEMPGAKMTTMEYVPIRNEQINWVDKIVTFGGEQYSIDLLVPDRKTQLVGLQHLTKLTGSGTFANEMAKIEAKAYNKARDASDKSGGGVATYAQPTKKIIETECVVEGAEVETPPPPPPKEENTNGNSNHKEAF
jgi:hypothetical protein